MLWIGPADGRRLFNVYRPSEETRGARALYGQRPVDSTVPTLACLRPRHIVDIGAFAPGGRNAPAA